MIISGIIKNHSLFNNLYGFLQHKLGNSKFVIMLLSVISGVLPIEGRSSVSAGILDTATSHKNCIGKEHLNSSGRKKLGVVDFITTHHFYMWSPLEKPVLLPMAAFGIGYAAWMSMMWPLILVSAIFIIGYIWFIVDKSDVVITVDADTISISEFAKNILPFIVAIISYMVLGGEGASLVIPIFGTLLLYYIILTKTFDVKQLNSYINWNTIIIVAIVFALSEWMQEHRAWFEHILSHAGVDIHTMTGLIIISVLTFLASFSMGSDGKFAAITVLMATIFGKEYLVWFFVLDYAGYLLSPMHECVMIGKRYFGTPLSTYYTALLSWVLLLLITGGLVTFVSVLNYFN
jgi:hypothetical protein